jgi:thiamine-phosphate diphosphorylase/hydroxyethylthiazole kinase
VDNGADYVGIGPVWSTNSKDVTHKKILGCDGVGAILEVLAGTGVEAVAIGASSLLAMNGLTRLGGVHTPNLPQLLHGSIAPDSRNRLAGVAVISDIVSSIDPLGSARMLREVIDSFKRSRSGKGDTTAIFSPSWQSSTKIHDLIEGVMALMGVVKKETPLIHQVSPLSYEGEADGRLQIT